MPADIVHPTLGTLAWNGKLNSWESQVDYYPDWAIDIRLVRRSDVEPTHKIDELLSRGVAMLEWARDSDSLCRETIADKMLDLHNDTWAADDAQGPMSRSTFCERIIPYSLTLGISGSGFFYWDDDDLFAGHWIELRFRKDLTISEVGLSG